MNIDTSGISALEELHKKLLLHGIGVRLISPIIYTYQAYYISGIESYIHCLYRIYLYIYIH